MLGSALEEVDAGRYGDLAERLDAELTVSAWLRAETYPIARDRLERFDPSTLNGGLGSELRLANVAFYELRLARDRHKAIEAARQALASGRLGQTGTASFHFGVYTLLGAGLFDEAIVAYDRALADAQRRGDVVQLSACLVFRGRCRIGDLVRAGDAVGDVDGALVVAPIAGLLRGLLADGVPVPTGVKVGDVDPRGRDVDPSRVSDKGRAVAAGALEAILIGCNGLAASLRS